LLSCHGSKRTYHIPLFPNELVQIMEYVIQFVNASLNLPDFQFAFRYERLLKGSRSCCRPVNIPNQIETFSSLAESSLPDRTLLKKLNLFWRRASCVPNQRRGRDVSWIARQCGTSLQIGIFCAMPIVVHLPRQPRLLSRYLVFQLLRRYLLSPLEGKYSSRKFLRYPLLCRAILSKWMSSQGSGQKYVGLRFLTSSPALMLPIPGYPFLNARSSAWCSLSDWPCLMRGRCQRCQTSLDARSEFPLQAFPESSAVMGGTELVNQSVDTLDIAVHLEDLKTDRILESVKVIYVCTGGSLSRMSDEHRSTYDGCSDWHSSV
jgi:hypothetical protein